MPHMLSGLPHEPEPDDVDAATAGDPVPAQQAFASKARTLERGHRARIRRQHVSPEFFEIENAERDACEHAQRVGAVTATPRRPVADDDADLRSPMTAVDLEEPRQSDERV